MFVGDDVPWLSAGGARRRRADRRRCSRRLAAEIDPDDPWSHPDAARLDQLSLGAWLRLQGALPAVRRRYALASLSLSCDGPDRSSLLADLRKHATLAGNGFYDLAEWEGLRCAAGSAEVALRMAAELGARVRLGAVVARVEVLGPRGVVVGLADGEEIRAEAVVCALPAGPLRAVEITGLSDARLASLRALRQALAAKLVVAYPDSFWQRNGQNGLAETEWLFGSTWSQGEGVLSLLVPPERLSAFLAAPPDARRGVILGGLEALYGEGARSPSAFIERPWGADPFTLGYITSWAPGDLMAAGPLHGHARAPVLRRRLRPLGGRLHGGRGAHRARGGAGGAGRSAPPSSPVTHLGVGRYACHAMGPARQAVDIGIDTTEHAGPDRAPCVVRCRFVRPGGGRALRLCCAGPPRRPRRRRGRRPPRRRHVR